MRKAANIGCTGLADLEGGDTDFEILKMLSTVGLGISEGKGEGAKVALSGYPALDMPVFDADIYECSYGYHRLGLLLCYEFGLMDNIVEQKVKLLG